MDSSLKDLADIHNPISNIFTSILDMTDIDLMKFKLTEQQLQFFQDNGYVTNIPCLSEKQVDILLKELDPILQGESSIKELFHWYHSNENPDPNEILFHALGAWRVSPAFHDILWHAPILVASKQILEGSVRFWHDQLFCKPGKNGSVVAWHQDYSYWTRTLPMAHLTVHIALDEQKLENGCLHYIPGSHKWPLLPITSRHFNDMDSIQSILTQEQKSQFKPTPMLLKKGEMCFHHPLTVHGSYGNKSDGPRRATVLNFFKDGTLSDTDEPLLTKIPIIPKGQKLHGKFFPLLY